MSHNEKIIKYSFYQSCYEKHAFSFILKEFGVFNHLFLPIINFGDFLPHNETFLCD